MMLVWADICMEYVEVIHPDYIRVMALCFSDVTVVVCALVLDSVPANLLILTPHYISSQGPY